MKALNQAERNQLYLKFFLLFIVTVSISVFALFFNMDLPAQLTNAQRQKLKSYNAFLLQKKSIVHLMDTLNTQIMDLDKSSRGWEIEKEEIVKQINFKSMISDTTAPSITAKLDNTFVNFLAVKVKAIKLREEAEEAKNDLSKAKEESKSKEELNETLLEIERSKEK